MMECGSPDPWKLRLLANDRRPQRAGAGGAFRPIRKAIACTSLMTWSRVSRWGASAAPTAVEREEYPSVAASGSPQTGPNSRLSVYAAPASIVERKLYAESIEHALAGDARAASELVDILAPWIQREVIKVLCASAGRVGRGLRQDVEDLVQDTLLFLFSEGGKVLRAWDPERGSFGGFVRVVARHQAHATLRSRRRSPYELNPEDPVAPQSSAQSVDARDPERVAHTRRSLERLTEQLTARLSPLGFEMFRLLFVLDMPASAITEATGQSLEAVYQWRTRIKKLVTQLNAGVESGGAQSRAVRRRQ